MAKRVPPLASWMLDWLVSGDPRARVSRFSGLAVTTLVAASVGMMIVPLPTFLLDLLISFNIAIAVTLLLVAIYVADGLKIATFPSLLLLSTLFRLAIEISATRLILLKADAGQVIYAFGSFVVASNLVVGLVVFAILTTVQFIVVAKGAERVAEVGARFTLDALPGKQMAIDAELRAGHIDPQEAQNRRKLLVRESQFFGAMDGAMKFVKGDAIAGIVILLANVVGGLVIGVLQRGMELGNALHTYTLLTVGEGLVSQIPALIISTAAGIVVTRVSSEEEGTHLGGEIAGQILAQPKALAFSSALLALLALVPGLPAVPFLALAAILGLLAFKLIRGHTSTGSMVSRQHSRASLTPELLLPLSLDLSPALSRAVKSRLASELLPLLWEKHFDETGVLVATLRICESDSLPTAGYAIRLHEGVVASGQVTLQDASVGQAPEEAIVDHLRRVLRRHGHQLVGVEETQALLERLSRTHPTLVREVVPKLISPLRLAEVLQCLAREGISLRYLAQILAALGRRASLQGDPAELAEGVRASLQRPITAKYSSPDGTVASFVLDGAIEDALRESIQRCESGSHLALEPELAQDIVESIGRAVAGVDRPVVIGAADIRRHLRHLIESDHPDVAVLAYQELLPEAKLETLGRISIEG
jgi:type III secretion protein V